MTIALRATQITKTAGGHPEGLDKILEQRSNTHTNSKRPSRDLALVRHEAKPMMDGGTNVAKGQNRRAARDKEAGQAKGRHHPNGSSDTKRHRGGNGSSFLHRSGKIGSSNPEEDIAKPRKGEQNRVYVPYDARVRKARSTPKRYGHAELPGEEVEGERGDLNG